MNTLDLKQAAAFLKMHPKEVRRRARLGLLPGAKTGKAWLEWHWLDRAPKVKLYPEAKRRVRWSTPEQARALLRELPSHQRDIVTFALATGLRQANVAHLEWQHVDRACGTCWIPGDRAKGGDDLHVSLNEAALAVLQRQRGEHRERVFSYHGKPVNQVNTKAWRAALHRAGIDNFRWHDLRHTWASWLVQHGTPLYDLQEMGGWKCAAMVRRYAHLAPAQMARHAAVVGGLLVGDACRSGRHEPNQSGDMQFE